MSYEQRALCCVPTHFVSAHRVMFHIRTVIMEASQPTAINLFVLASIFHTHTWLPPGLSRQYRRVQYWHFITDGMYHWGRRSWYVDAKVGEHVVLGIAINTFDEKSWNDIVKKKELGSSNKLRDNIRRKLQDEQATTPTIITSITFIELNALGTVINVDDQYMNGNFDNGALINLQSISSTISANIPLENQLELVPSTQVLFMEGLNAAGEEVRGRFVWNYTNSCASNAVAIRQGDELAWIQFTEVEEQIFSICPANENVVPTIVPIDIITPNPTVSFMRYSMQLLFRLYHDELILLPFNSQLSRPSRKDQCLRYLRHRRSSGLLNRHSYHHWWRLIP